MKNYSISLYLDTRRAKKNGLYPLKLQVFTNNPKKQKYFPTVFEFSKTDFHDIWHDSRIKFDNDKSEGFSAREKKDKKTELQALLVHADNIAQSLPEFNFIDFEKELLGSSNKQKKDLKYYFNWFIENSDKHSTSESYRYTLNSLINFHDKAVLNFNDIDSKWLEAYESSMLQNGKSITTVGIFTRTLRAVFNHAIDEGTLNKSLYPFGKKKYVIPASKPVDKIIDNKYLKELFEGTPKTEMQQKAKDFWFFSYACNGMNLKDVALLKYKDLKEDVISFNRAKTKDARKGNPVLIKVYLNDFSKSVINKYGNEIKEPESFIFPILRNEYSEQEKDTKIKSFNDTVNKNMKRYCKDLKLNIEISNYHARHTFKDKAEQAGATITEVSEMLGHSNGNVTMGYGRGKKEKKFRYLSKKIMNFEPEEYEIE